MSAREDCQRWIVDLIDTGQATNTGGRIKRLAPYLGGETFMLTWGDGVSSVDLGALLAFHRRHGRLATVTAVRPPARFGRLEIEDGAVRRFSEKPQMSEGWINGAFFVLESGVFDYIKDDQTQWEREPLERLASDGQLMAYQHDGFWQCMDTLRDKVLLEELWSSGRAPWLPGEGDRGEEIMKVLLTGHDGYIGRVLVPRLLEAGHQVTGLDNGLIDGCGFDEGPSCPSISALWLDVRDVTADDLVGYDAIIHLAGISNDPLGDLTPETTFEINWQASVRLARLAKEAGVRQFLFASSCSNYGAAGDETLDETASFNPVTPYAVSKVKVEGELQALANEDFSPVYMRAATAYGMSPRLRGDLVVNNLVGYAVTTGTILLKSDGSSVRPLVHVEDIARAYVAVLAAQREVVHNQAFNVGRSEENYAIRIVAELVAAALPGVKIAFAPGANPDRRNYRVSCEKIRQRVPAFKPTWTVPRGIEQLRDAYRTCGLTEKMFLGARFFRLEHVKERITAGTLDAALRPTKRAA